MLGASEPILRTARTGAFIAASIAIAAGDAQSLGSIAKVAQPASLNAFAALRAIRISEDNSRRPPIAEAESSPVRPHCNSPLVLP